MTDDADRQLLVALLKEAAKLEHCLLDAYLYAAASLKSTPQEFATLSDGRVNPRRAIQFERARAWKQSILDVAHEEMLHLHYVQCLLRALGEPPSFALPDRDTATGEWIMRDWKAMIGDEPVDGGKGVRIPVDGATLKNLRQFMLYESTDALQDADPFGPEMTELYGKLADIEGDLYRETILLNVPEADRARMRDQLIALYNIEIPPGDHAAVAAALAAEPPEVPAVQFQSIADLYNLHIKPLYQKAFDNGWVTHDNRNFNNELLDPAYAAEGFLPIGPVYRDKNFSQKAAHTSADPLLHYKDADSIIDEIVEEGEGATNFVDSAHSLLGIVAEHGAADYVKGLVEDAGNYAAHDNVPTPPWLAEGELVRGSHLYRFIQVHALLQDEDEISRRGGVKFDPTRAKVDTSGWPQLQALSDSIPAQFNACYTVLLAWLSRMYEIPHWLADKPRRQAIEMLASWPLMSMAIRPLLELASFFPLDPLQLFRVSLDALPTQPESARRLFELWTRPERSEEINAEIDRLAGETLAGVAAWAAKQAYEVKGVTGLGSNERTMIAGRLDELALLVEFDKEYPYRVAGGYSDREPDLTYQQLHPGGDAYSENPTDLSALFQDSLVLRLRFAGWGLVQLATDPDPTFDEVGVTGTMMLHAADGDRRFNRALVWQDTDPASTILREPRADLPPLGVNLVDASLAVAGDASAGYIPLQMMSSTGAVQTSGIQMDLEVDGLSTVASLPAASIAGKEPILIDLLPRNGTKPFLNGINHVVSQDGEAIDPFVLAVSIGGIPPFLQRGAFSPETTFLDMSPLQRLDSARRPVGFDALSNVPAWARDVFPEELRPTIDSPSFAAGYLHQRSTDLGRALAQHLDAPDRSQPAVDAALSLAERLRLINNPRSTTVAWLGVILHYGHTVSGDMKPPVTNPVVASLAQRTGLPLQVATGVARDKPNGRWLAKYTKGVLDTDALSDLVYGELYIPMTLTDGTQDGTLQRTWEFPKAMRDVVEQYACSFQRPFWAHYTVDGNERSTTLPNGTVTHEHFVSKSGVGYTYTVDGLGGVPVLDAVLDITSDPLADTKLRWKIKFSAGSAAAAFTATSYFAAVAGEMEAALTAYFAPRPSG